MTSLFEQELIAMEREVRDLKTIRQRGIGTTIFYSESLQKTHNYYTDVAVSIASDEPMPAIITIAANIPQPLNFPMLVFVPQTDGALFDVLGGAASGIAKIKVFSSSKIGSVT